MLIQKWLKSKKSFVCVWCGETIPRGELHLHRIYDRINEEDPNIGLIRKDQLHNECSVALATFPDQDDMMATGFQAGSFVRGRYERREI